MSSKKSPRIINPKFQYETRTQFLKASSDLRDDPEYIIEGIKRFGHSVMMAASERLKNERQCMMQSLELTHGATFSYASRELKNDYEFIKFALEISPLVYCDLLKKWRVEFVSYGLSNPCRLYKYLPKAYQNDPDILRECAYLVFEFLDEHHRDDEALFFRAFRGSRTNFKYASDRIKNKRQYVLMALSANGRLLEYVPEIFKDDRECVMIAISNDPHTAFQFASGRMRDDKEIALLAMDGYGMKNYKHLSLRLQNDPELIDLKDSFTFDGGFMGCQ